MISRPRRNRNSESVRRLVRETHLHPSKLVLPLFLLEGKDVRSAIDSLPGVYRQTEEHLANSIQEAIDLGITAFMIFPVIPEHYKDAVAGYASNPDNFYLRTVSSLRSSFPDVVLISDTAMDPYSIDGHDGLVKDGRILNDETLPILADMAVAQARAGFDIIGPSDMMDGRVAFIRERLDQHGFTGTGIMSYTAKYASAFYGPFRDALDSAPRAGDKKSYQMDYANRREALREAELDEAEGADFLMVKPALHYMDIISDLSQTSNLPVAAYHVSGECAMLRAACNNGWLQYEKAMPETLISLHRAGADVIISYFAADYARWYRGEL